MAALTQQIILQARFVSAAEKQGDLFAHISRSTVGTRELLECMFQMAAEAGDMSNISRLMISRKNLEDMQEECGPELALLYLNI
ncbi:hypothetical protein OJAV_G00052950 [Oryzias javanicus]|uniref:Uncharacterized protein n=1 Tax=Oryzias javanicus TaxID=123683 RepID=A0A3S2PEC9_ORYJA|nr:hypothetical protein OJAV_G00052950 [Oryzias javanicus]